MKPLRIGVLGGSEFAGRAMLPAMKAVPETELRAVASRSAEKARDFADRFGCAAVEGYAELLRRDDIDAVYVPLPPGLHAEWVSRALEAGKHVLVEKPFVTDADAAGRLLAKARQRRLLVMENFLFLHHSQYAWVRERLAAGEIGTVRLFRTTFTIPPLEPGNFRYQAALGGGALWDMGAYIVRFATAFMGEPLRLVGATLHRDCDRGIDVWGTVQFAGRGQSAQGSFGFDTHYQCAWEFLGTGGRMVVERGYTPPPGFTPVVRIERPDGSRTITLPADDHYRNMCRYFSGAVLGGAPFEEHWKALDRQASLLDRVRAEAVAL